MRLLLAEDEKSLPKAIIVILQKTITLLMPKLDGISVLKKIRAQGNTVPVLMKKRTSAISLTTSTVEINLAIPRRAATALDRPLQRSLWKHIRVISMLNHRMGTA